jgi:predicted dehydrogenase
MRTIALIGLGGRLSGVVTNLMKAAGDRLRLVGYADAAPVGLPNLRQAGIDPGQAFTDHRAMLAQLKPDVVMIGSPNHLHLEHIRDALAAGCEVFSEKPVTISPEDTWEVARLIGRYGAKRLHVGLVLRSSPLYRRVRAILAAGGIGKPISMEANEHLHVEHGAFIIGDWRRYRKWSGSHILEKCCHDFDLYNSLAGCRAARVASFGGRDSFVPEHAALATGTHPDGKPRYQAWGRAGWNAIGDTFTSDADITDNQVAVVEYTSGFRLSFHTNTHCPSHQRRWLISGTKGWVESDLATSRISWRETFGQVHDEAVGDCDGGHGGADAVMGRDLAATLLDGAAFPVPATAALEAGLLCMAIDRAQREGRVVELAPWWAQLDAALQPQAAQARA